MLVYDPEARATAMDCLKHPWLEPVGPPSVHFTPGCNTPRSTNSSRSVSPLTEGSGGIKFGNQILGRNLYPNQMVSGHSPTSFDGHLSPTNYIGHRSSGHLGMVGSVNYSHHHLLPVPGVVGHVNQFDDGDDEDQDLDEEDDDGGMIL